MNWAVEIEDMTVAYDRHPVLWDVDMKVPQGALAAVLGPNGAGKSTLLKLLTGVLKAEKGHILVDGQEIKGVTEHFAYMPQNDLLFPWKTILENVCLYGRIHGSADGMKEQARKQMEAFGLKGYEDEYPSSLSGGMRQRAAFLRTLLCHADILLLDEPFGALDVITRGEMQDWLLSVRKQMNRTVLLVTHDMDEAIYLSDRILVLDAKKGKVRQEFTVKEEKRNREWLYEQGALRREIYKEIMEGKVNV